LAYQAALLGAYANQVDQQLAAERVAVASAQRHGSSFWRWARVAGLAVGAVALTVINGAQAGVDPVTDGLEVADVSADAAAIGDVVAGGDAAAEGAGIPAGSTADAATSGSPITSSVRNKYFQDGAEPPTCSYCQQNPAEHLDHVIPRSQGGDLSPENLTPACSWCNLSKGARPAPVNPPSNFVGEWPPSFWPTRMLDWWNSTYGGP